MEAKAPFLKVALVWWAQVFLGRATANTQVLALRLKRENLPETLKKKWRAVKLKRTES